MGALRAEHVPFSVVIPLGSKSTDGDPLAGALWYAHRKCKITMVAVADNAGIPASNTDFTILKLKNGSDVVASYDTRAAGQGALAANVAKEALVDSTKSEIAAGSTLVAAYDETDSGTSVALTSGVMIVSGFWIQTA